jgi:hypothetical protein
MRKLIPLLILLAYAAPCALANKLYMKINPNLNSNLFATYYASDLNNNADFTAAVASVTQTTASPPKQLTATSGGANLAWISPPLASAVTISGTVTFNGWGNENNALANAGFEVQVIKYTAGAESTTVIDSSFGTELGTGNAANNWTGSPTSTTFAIGDRIVVKWFINSAGGSMAASYTATMHYGGRTTAATGDTYVNFTETLSFQAEPQLIQTEAGASGGGNTNVIYWDNNTVAGHAIICSAQWLDQAGTLTSFADSGSSSYTVIDGPTHTGSTITSYVWYAKNGAASSSVTTTITSSPSDIYTDCFEFDGLDNTAAADITHAAGGTSAPSMTTGAGSNTNYAYELVAANFASDQAGGAGQPFTAGSGYWGVGTGDVLQFDEFYATQSTVASPTATATNGNSGNHYWGVLMTLKGAYQPSVSGTGAIGGHAVVGGKAVIGP